MTEFELIERYFGSRVGSSAQGGGASRPQAGGEPPAQPVGEAVAGDGGPTAGPAPVLGIGDDCALLMPPRPGELLAVSTDMLVEGRHFFAGTAPAAIGHKTLAVNLSDLAAMGAEPLGFTLALALPEIREDWLAGFSAGLLDLARRHRCPLVGGDTTRGPLCLSVTVFGTVPATSALRRDGARIGDDVWVSGDLGGAALAVRERLAGREPAGRVAERLDWPRPRLGLGLRLRGLADAAIDLSDGLAGDLGHLLAASSRRAASGRTDGHEPGLGAELDLDALPIDPGLDGLPLEHRLDLALRGGDDYELLFTAPPDVRARIAALDGTDGFGATPPRRIGRIIGEGGLWLVAPDGRRSALTGTGFDHFAGAD